MAQLGTISLLLGLALTIYSVVGSVIGYKRGTIELQISARRAAYLTTPVSIISALALVLAFANNDFSIRYVFEHSSTVMDRAFVWVAFYAGNEGSLLYISMVLAIMATTAILFAPKRFAPSLPYTTAVLMGILAFFYTVLIFFANPFDSLDFAANEGRGINPLLTHPGMFIHPPLLMAGLVGVAIPFAYATGALIAGHTKDEWLDVARISGIVVWAILGIGMLIGAWWAYTILGWGGYWSWDPIENVAFMPWLGLTTFLHSIMVQKRRGMFRMWNIVLLNISFVLSQFGMFINRGGPVVSVHSFGASTIGMVFLGFMLFSLLFAFTIFLWRYPVLKSDRALDSFLSRESAFLVNNFLLLGVVGVTIWGVIFPLINEFAQETTVTVATPYFNRINGPLLLTVIALMGIGPMLPWRRATVSSLRKWLLPPVVLAVTTFITMLATGFDEPIALIAFSVIVFVATSIFQEWARGTIARRRGGDQWIAAFARHINGNRPRHGGYVVHLSILVFAFGVVGTQFYDQRTDEVLAPGENFVIDNYRVEFISSESNTREDRIAKWAILEVFDGDQYLGKIQPWQAFYPGFNQVSVRAGIRSTPIEDLYIVPTDFLEDGRAVFRVSINPLAWWLWIAGPVFILGTIIALWPQSSVELRFVNPSRTESKNTLSSIDV